MSLSVFVGEFKMGGPEANMTKGWPMIRGVIAADGPAQSLCFWVVVMNIDSDLPGMIRAPLGHVPLLSSQSVSRRRPRHWDAVRDERSHGAMRREVRRVGQHLALEVVCSNGAIARAPEHQRSILRGAMRTYDHRGQYAHEPIT